MTVKDITRLLERSLLRDGEMHHTLYEYELEEIVDNPVLAKNRHSVVKHILC